MTNKDDLERLRHAKRTHQTHWTVPELPWHKKKEEDKPRDNAVHRVPKEIRPSRDSRLTYCHCGVRGKYLLDRWYCEECWEAGDDE